jgi:hypothetical protein
MKRAASVLTFALLTPACGLFAPGQAGAHVASVQSVTATTPLSAAQKAPSDPRKIGDFTVHRFSGSYQKSPLTMTEEVVAKEGALWVIDYTLEDQSGTTKLRVRFDPNTDAVVQVAKLDDGVETNAAIATYEQMVERTSFAADSNDGQVASVHGTCLIGPNELECETKSYKVWVGEREAVLNVSHSDSVPNGDVSGDITASDGTLIYRSELVEMGNSAAPRAGVASR